jgi:hypothetical protein
MPFDGAYFPEPPEAKPTIAKRVAAVFRPKPQQDVWQGPVPTRLTKARQAVIALTELEVLLGDGKKWVQRSYQDGRGGHCLVGGLWAIRAKHGITGDADTYLRHAIRRTNSSARGIESFNDRCQSYADIKAVIVLAKQLAQMVVEQYKGPPCADS